LECFFSEAKNHVRLFCVPAVYLTWVNSLFEPFFAFDGINNLRVFNVAFSPIPTSPTVQLFAAALVLSKPR